MGASWCPGASWNPGDVMAPGGRLGPGGLLEAPSFCGRGLPKAEGQIGHSTIPRDNKELSSQLRFWLPRTMDTAQWQVMTPL